MQIGLSPKVALPAAALAAVGAALLVVGALTSTHELVVAGVAVVGAAGVHLPIGFAAPAGTVVHSVADVASDELLHPAVKEKLEQIDPVPSPPPEPPTQIPVQST